MIVEIIKENYQWMGTDVTGVCLEKNEVGFNLMVRTACDYGSYTYPLTREKSAIGAYDKISRSLFAEYTTGKPIIITVIRGIAEEIPTERSVGLEE